MATYQLGDGTGHFKINGESYPKGKYFINKSGPRVSIISINNLTFQITGRYNEWIGVLGETFANADEAGNYIDDLISSLGVDDDDVLRILL